MKRWLKQLFCRHTDLTFVRNIYGDEINAAGGKRSWWICNNCGKMKLRSRLGGMWVSAENKEKA